jgi:hypothetical protein
MEGRQGGKFAGYVRPLACFGFVFPVPIPYPSRHPLAKDGGGVHPASRIHGEAGQNGGYNRWGIAAGEVKHCVHTREYI